MLDRACEEKKFVSGRPECSLMHRNDCGVAGARLEPRREMLSDDVAEVVG